MQSENKILNNYLPISQKVMIVGIINIAQISEVIGF